MNKKYFLLTCLAAFPFALTAQENNRYEEITNPKLTSINREPARSTFTSYVTEADAVINDRNFTDYCKDISLSFSYFSLAFCAALAKSVSARSGFSRKSLS